jgi:hypothetical protein
MTTMTRCAPAPREWRFDLVTAYETLVELERRGGLEHRISGSIVRGAGAGLPAAASRTRLRSPLPRSSASKGASLPRLERRLQWISTISVSLSA